VAARMGRGSVSVQLRFVCTLAALLLIDAVLPGRPGQTRPAPEGPGIDPHRRKEPARSAVRNFSLPFFIYDTFVRSRSTMAHLRRNSCKRCGAACGLWVQRPGGGAMPTRPPTGLTMNLWCRHHITKGDIVLDVGSRGTTRRHGQTCWRTSSRTTISTGAAMWPNTSPCSSARWTGSLSGGEAWTS